MPRGNRKAGAYTEELKDTVREYFLSSPHKPELAWLAANSVSLFGQFVPEETLKDWKRYDGLGDWEHLHALFHPASSDEEMENVIKRIYEIAVDPTTPAAVVPGAVKAWAELRDKYKPQKGSAKTSPDVAEAIAKRVLREYNEGKF